MLLAGVFILAHSSLSMKRSLSVIRRRRWRRRQSRRFLCGVATSCGASSSVFPLTAADAVAAAASTPLAVNSRTTVLLFFPLSIRFHKR